MGNQCCSKRDKEGKVVSPYTNIQTREVVRTEDTQHHHHYLPASGPYGASANGYPAPQQAGPYGASPYGAGAGPAGAAGPYGVPQQPQQQQQQLLIQGGPGQQGGGQYPRGPYSHLDGPQGPIGGAAALGDANLYPSADSLSSSGGGGGGGGNGVGGAQLGPRHHGSVDSYYSAQDWAGAPGGSANNNGGLAGAGGAGGVGAGGANGQGGPGGQSKFLSRDFSGSDNEEGGWDYPVPHSDAAGAGAGGPAGLGGSRMRSASHDSYGGGYGYDEDGDSSPRGPVAQNPPKMFSPSGSTSPTKAAPVARYLSHTLSSMQKSKRSSVMAVAEKQTAELGTKTKTPRSGRKSVNNSPRRAVSRDSRVEEFMNSESGIW